MGASETGEAVGACVEAIVEGICQIYRVNKKNIESCSANGTKLFVGRAISPFCLAVVLEDLVLCAVAHSLSSFGEKLGREF